MAVLHLAEIFGVVARKVHLHELSQLLQVGEQLEAAASAHARWLEYPHVFAGAELGRHLHIARLDVSEPRWRSVASLCRHRQLIIEVEIVLFVKFIFELSYRQNGGRIYIFLES